MTGALVRRGAAPHPPGTEVDPEAWWAALQTALADAGGLDDVAAVSVGGQQHGLVCLDSDGRVIRAALLWNDTRSAAAAEATSSASSATAIGRSAPRAWADAVGIRSGGGPDRGEASLAGRPRAGERCAHRRHRPAARLAHLAASRRHLARHLDHRPVRRVGHRVLRRGERQLPPRSPRARVAPRRRHRRASPARPRPERAGRGRRQR